jgi:hypothetical protein
VNSIVRILYLDNHLLIYKTRSSVYTYETLVAISYLQNSNFYSWQLIFPMRPIKNHYILLGVGLLLLGAALSLISYFILESTPLTALGISTFILGAICVALSRTRPNISPEVSVILLETGVENTAAIVEELGLNSSAIYIPSSATREGGNAVIPISPKTNVQIRDNIPKRLITKYGNADDDIGIMVTTPGKVCLRILREKPGSTTSEIEAAITSLIAGTLDIADKARVNISDGRAVVEIINPRLKLRDTKFYRCIGSPLASMVATLVCEAMNKPLVIEAEKRGKGKAIIELRIME